MNRKVLAIIALVILVGSVVVLPQVSAERGQSKVSMTITNTKTGTVKTLEWTAAKYDYEKNISIDVDDIKLKKLKQIFDTAKFSFAWQTRVHEAMWYHFKVSIEANPTVGSNLQVTFI